jgi:hypothetical protein
MTLSFSPRIPWLTPDNITDATTLRHLTEFLRELSIQPGENQIVSRLSGQTYLSTEARAGGGSAGATSVWPAKIDNYDSGTDTHRVDIYANGFGESITTANQDLDEICNLAANEELPVGTELFVTLAGDEYIGLVNGIF